MPLELYLSKLKFFFSVCVLISVCFYDIQWMELPGLGGFASTIF